MTFEHDGMRVNILDTPGHKDFAEDTYRTLTAVDSVILVIDSVNGVEEQTKKLTEVCRMRDTPIIIFINKTHSTISGTETCNPLIVFLELDSDALSDSGVGLLGFNGNFFDNDSCCVGGTSEWFFPFGS